MKYCFGVDIGGTTVKMGLFEKTGAILEKWEIKTHTEEEGKAILPDVAAWIKEKMNEHQLTSDDIIGIGAGVRHQLQKKVLYLEVQILAGNIKK